VKVTFITFGGFKIGMGHVLRSITLAEELREHAQILFIVNSDETVLAQITKAGFSCEACSDVQVITRLKEISPHPHVVIIDKLNVKESFAKELKTSLNIRLVIFGNDTAANDHADIVVNAVVGSGFVNRTLKNKNTVYFYGPKYYVLRKDFYEYQERHKDKPSNIKSIVLAFGGSDPANLTSTTLMKLLQANQKYKIDIILGAHFAHSLQIEKLLEDRGTEEGSIKLYRNVNNMAEIMYNADLVITSPGVSFFEALCVGTNVIAINQSAQQKKWFDGFVPTLNKGQINKIPEMIRKKQFIKPFSPSIKRLAIGSGKNEIVKAILE